MNRRRSLRALGGAVLGVAAMTSVAAGCSKRTRPSQADAQPSTHHVKTPWLDEDIQPLALSEPDIDDLVAFMVSLTSPDYASLGQTELAHQRQQAQSNRPQRDTKRAFEPKPPQPKRPR